MEKDDGKYLGTKGCADYIRRSPGAVRNLVMRKAIPYRKLGGRLIFLRDEIDRWIENADGVTFEDLTKQNG